MDEPLTRSFRFAALSVRATLSPLRGARGSRHTHRECPSSPREHTHRECPSPPRERGRRCREAADEGEFRLIWTALASCQLPEVLTGNGQLATPLLPPAPVFAKIPVHV